MVQFIKNKIKVLKQFHVHIRDDELQHLRGLKTEIAVDNYARSLILHSLGDD